MDEPENTPSAKILAMMKAQQMPFCKFGMQASENTQKFFEESAIDSERLAEFKAASQHSVDEHTAGEAAEDSSFDEFLTRWNDYHI